MTNPLVGHMLGSHGHVLLGHVVCHVLSHVTGLRLGHVMSHMLDHMVGHMLGHRVGISQGHMVEDSLWLLVIHQALSWARKGIG